MRLSFLIFAFLCSCRQHVIPEIATPPKHVDSSNRYVDSSACPVYGTIVSAPVDQEVIVAFEGIRTNLYQPTDASGPTIGIGLDISAAGPDAVRAILSGLVPVDTLDTLLAASGLHGAPARRWIARHQSLKLDSCAIQPILTRQCFYYWRFISGARPYLNQAPREVRTALLSFFMHTGSIEPFASEIRSRNWDALATHIETFNDSNTGEMVDVFKMRRQLEAKLIRLRNSPRTIDPD